LAAFSLAAFLVLLAGIGLISLRPWETTSLSPRLSVAPGIGEAPEESVVVAPPRRPDVGLAASRVAGRSATQSGAAGAGVPRTRPASRIGISAARPVQSPVTAAPPAGSPEPQAPAPEPQPVSLPAAPPAEASSTPQSAEPAVADAESGEELSGAGGKPQGAASPAGAAVVVPRLRTPIAVRLSGNQDSSEPILAGEAEGGGAVQIREGDEYALAFSFYIQSMVYGEPGAPNLIMRMVGDAGPGPSFGLQLWDYGGADGLSGGRGLWSAGEAMGGDRFLAPVSEWAWHDVVVRFSASSQGVGYYALYLDGQPIDVRLGVSMIPPGSSFAQIEIGLFRDGELLPGTSEIWVDAVTLSEIRESVPLP
jgi:hypothetical protein